MAALKDRKIRIIITGVILIACVIISYYYATLPEKTSLTFLGNKFNVDDSRSIIIGVTIFFTLISSFFINIFSGDVHESIKQDDSANQEPKVIVPPIEIKNIINPLPESNPTPTPKLVNQKFYPNYFLPELKFFVGRVEVLQKIKDTLEKDRRASIHDISGLGKTFTTYKFAEDNKDNYDKIFFVRATREEMLESLAKCGEMVDPQLASVQEQKAKALGFKQWLEENEKWLVIYDNVDIPGELFPFVPVNLKGDCLFTSNFREVTRLGPEIKIVKLGKTDAEILLYSRTNNQPHKLPELDGEEEKKAFDNLIREIDGLPLTLNSTGAYIYRKDWTFVKCWQKYQQTPEIAWESEDDYSTYQRKSAGIVFSLAYNELSEAENTGTAVKILLNALSFLSPDEVPEDLVFEILQDQYEPFAKMENTADFWDEVREKMTGYDLLKYDKYKKIFTTHRSIQRVIQTKIKTEEKKAVCVQLCQILLNLFPEYDYSNRETCEKYFQHVQTLLENTDKLEVETEETNRLFFLIGLYQELLGNFTQAGQFFCRAMEVSAKVWGEESNNYAASLNNVASVYISEGRYDEAIEKSEEALRIGEKTIGKKHPNYATALNNLASAYKSKGRYDEAILKLEEALRIGEKTIGKEHRDYATRLNNLGEVYRALGRFDEAIEKYKEASQIDEKSIGKEHPDYAADLNNLALVYEAQDKYKEALDLYEEALSICEKTLPENHLYNVLLRERVEGCRKKL